MKTSLKSVSEIKAGDIIVANGGRFQAAEDSAQANYWSMEDHTGPLNCAIVRSICIEGEVKGYFKPGSEWNFQGTVGGCFGQRLSVEV